jgi:hypothetical protein
MMTRCNTGFSKLSLAAALGASVIILVSDETMAQENPFPMDLPATCTLENVAGVFGFNEETLSSPFTNEPVAILGVLDLRSDGTVTSQFRAFAELGGDLIVGEVVEGVWSVESNCLGSIDIETLTTPLASAEIDFEFVAVENGTELFLIRNNPLEEGDAKLLFRR